MVKIPRKITRDLENGLSLEETLIKHNTNLKALFEGKSSENEWLHIQPTRCNHFMINKEVNGKTEGFGTYATLQDAIIIRDCLILCNWDKSKLAEIKEKCKIKDSQGD